MEVQMVYNDVSILSESSYLSIFRSFVFHVTVEYFLVVTCVFV